MKCSFVFCIAVICAISVSGLTIPCNPTINGQSFDFTSLVAKNGSFLWQVPFNGSNTYFQVQLCGDVTAPISTACSGPAPVYQISADKSQCLALGSTAVSAWDLTPYDDGVRLTHFHGDPVDNIGWRQTSIYFLCNPHVTMSEILFEHVRSCVDPNDELQVGALYHFKFQTKYAC